jgi:hypothetical protein
VAELKTFGIHLAAKTQSLEIPVFIGRRPTANHRLAFIFQGKFFLPTEIEIPQKIFAFISVGFSYGRSPILWANSSSALLFHYFIILAMTLLNNPK